VAMTRFGGLVAVAATGALLSGCGGSSHTTAENGQLEGLPPATSAAATRCPGGQTLIRGHFHFEGCARSQTAHAALLCAETDYELETIVNQTLRDPQPTQLRHDLLRAASESIGVLKRTATELRASGENAEVELASLARHRAGLVAYLAKVRRTHVAQNLVASYKALLGRAQGCEPKLVKAVTPG
jgi:hypothetical protein